MTIRTQLPDYGIFTIILIEDDEGYTVEAYAEDGRWPTEQELSGLNAHVAGIVAEFEGEEIEDVGELCGEILNRKTGEYTPIGRTLH